MTLSNGTRSVNGDGSLEAHPKASESSDARPEELKHEIEQVRAQLDVLVAELDRRRHEATDVVLQARRHPLAAVVVAAAGLLVVSSLAISAYRALRPDPPVRRLRDLAHALSIAGRDPQRLLRALGE